MKLTLKQKVYAGIGIFLLILIITNPSISAFKAYVGSNSYRGLHRKTNLFIYSIYRDDRYDKYIGILGNFFYVEPPITTHTDSVQIGIKPDGVASEDSINKGLKTWTPPKTDKEVKSQLLSKK